jgi:hypothetical protein
MSYFILYLVLREQSLTTTYLSGGDGEEVTPVPIPNTEVKLLSADGSWGLPCESRTLPGKIGQRDNLFGLFLLFKECKNIRGFYSHLIYSGG